MALLKSRPLTKLASGFESLQLGESITYAEESLRKVLSYTNNAVTFEWEQREIILPVKKNKPRCLPSDSSGHILQGQLAEDIGSRYWHNLSKSQRNKIDIMGSLAYQAMNRDDFGSRTVFFRGIVALWIRELGAIQHHVIAAVEVHSLSGIWQAADVRFWESEAYPDTNTPRKYQGGSASVMSLVSPMSPLKDSYPPSFLM